MADQVLIADAGIPQCMAELDPTLLRGANFGSKFGVRDSWVNVRWFGAVGDGIENDADAIRDAVTYALSKKRTLWFPPGVYGVAGSSGTDPTACIHISTVDGISVVADKMATIKPLPEYGLSGSSKIVRVDGGNGTGRVSWVGGRFDLSALPGTETGADGLSIGPKYRDVVIRESIFDHGLTALSGDHFGRGGGDSGLYVKESEHLSITGCSFLGSYDLGIYLSSDINSARIGRNASISSNLFYRCGGGIGAKRGFENLSISGNQFIECGNGVFSGVADSNPLTASHLNITGNLFRRTQGNSIRLTNTLNATITGNEILDYRRWVSDGTTQTSVSTGNIGGGVLLEGSSGVVATGNIIGFSEWLPVTDLSRASPAVAIRDFSATGKSSNNNLFVGNLLVGAESAFYISDGSSGNLISPNNVIDCINSDRLGASETNRITQINGGILSLLANPAGSDVSIKATGSDANIDIGLLPQGSGLVQFGNFISDSGLIASGYIQIKDSSGAIRRLAVV